jgi:SOS response regulatory protein OraA/RecX
MNVRVTAIEPAGPGLRARRIVLDDFTERTTADAVVRSAAIVVGDVVSAEELESMLAGIEPGLARECALRLLAHRERSVAGLSRRLVDRGFPQAVVEAVVTSLAAIGLVDDPRFADLWTRSRVAAGYGTRRILRELAESGIEPELAEASLTAALDGADDVERARSLVRADPPRDRRERERALRRLIARGFDLSVAMRALDDDTPLTSDDCVDDGL